jgi:hypothetical protein
MIIIFVSFSNTKFQEQKIFQQGIDGPQGLDIFAFFYQRSIYIALPLFNSNIPSVLVRLVLLRHSVAGGCERLPLS